MREGEEMIFFKRYAEVPMCKRCENYDPYYDGDYGYCRLLKGDCGDTDRCSEFKKRKRGKCERS
jgi:hypothetical protein